MEAAPPLGRSRTAAIGISLTYTLGSTSKPAFVINFKPNCIYNLEALLTRHPLDTLFPLPHDSNIFGCSQLTTIWVLSVSEAKRRDVSQLHGAWFGGGRKMARSSTRFFRCPVFGNGKNRKEK